MPNGGTSHDRVQGHLRPRAWVPRIVPLSRGRRGRHDDRARPGGGPPAVHEPVRPLSALRRPGADPRALRSRLRAGEGGSLPPRLLMWIRVGRELSRASGCAAGQRPQPVRRDPRRRVRPPDSAGRWARRLRPCSRRERRVSRSPRRPVCVGAAGIAPAHPLHNSRRSRAGTRLFGGAVPE
jgi:hypothetical protein